MAILGLISTEQFATERYGSARRKVFYDYPNGNFPLAGLLSLMEGESCSDPEFNWWEKRMKPQGAITAEAGSGKGPFGGSGATTNNSWGTTLRTGGAGMDAGGASVVNEKVSMKVADYTLYRVGHIIQLDNLTLANGARQRVLLRVAAVNATGWLDCYFLTATAVGISNNGGAYNTGVQALIVGSSFAQGAAGASIAAYTVPVNPVNYCQIARTEFSFTGTAAKTSAKFDSTGLYKDRSKEASIDHMIELEKQILFGVRTKVLDASNIPTYTSGGILWFIEQWEAGSSGAFVLRSGTDIRTQNGGLDTDDNKRIIENISNSGIITEKLLDTWYERAFRKTSNKSNEKLVLCGNGSLQVVNQLYKNKSVLNADIPIKDTYGMDVVKHRTPFGTLWYKTHPLFNDDPTLRNNMLVIDVGLLNYRYLDGRDTDILPHRQANNVDGRTDEWLTESGLEMQYPEGCMYIKNVLDYAP